MLAWQCVSTIRDCLCALNANWRREKRLLQRKATLFSWNGMTSEMFAFHQPWSARSCHMSVRGETQEVEILSVLRSQNRSPYTMITWGELIIPINSRLTRTPADHLESGIDTATHLSYTMKKSMLKMTNIARVLFASGQTTDWWRFQSLGKQKVLPESSFAKA